MLPIHRGHGRKVLLIGALGLALSGCQATQNAASTGVSLNDWGSVPMAHAEMETNRFAQRRGNAPPQTAPAFAAPSDTYMGTGEFLGAQRDPRQATPSAQDGVTLNLVNTSIAEAAKTILGDILKLNYSVSSRVDGKITIQTSTPVSRSDLIDLFQNALQSSGAAVSKNGDIYQIVPLDASTRALSGLRVGPTKDSTAELGGSNRIIQLKYISASEMQRILEPIVPKGAILAIDDSRNTMTLAGTGGEISSILEMVAIFDIDVMRGMSVAIVPVSTAQPDAIADDVRTVFGSGKGGPVGGMVRFIPNRRLKSILVISSQPKYLGRAEMWIRRLDARAQGIDKQIFTYNVQNRPAKSLVAIIESLLGTPRTGLQTGDNIAPRSQEVAREGGAGTTPGFGASRVGGGINLSGQTSNGTPGQTTGTADPALSQSGPDPAVDPGGGDSARVRVTADETNNALLIFASRPDYQRVLRIIQSLDIQPKQVLIEATIAEVTLNDDLKFGMRWYFQKKNDGFGLTDAAANVFSSVYPGFSWARVAANVQVTLNALNDITQVNVVSSPTLMVIDNQQAVLQIGDQVPIVTQSAVGVVAATAPIVNSVAYRDTGVILSIKPRISENGRVMLNIEQEVSNVANTTSSGIDSPTIKQRKVKTTVAVNDGEAVALGGLIQDQAAKTRNQIPIVGDLPIFGNALGEKGSSVGKTELIVILTPHVVRNADDARRITDEYRRGIDVSMPHRRGPQRSISNTIERTFE